MVKHLKLLSVTDKFKVTTRLMKSVTFMMFVCVLLANVMSHELWRDETDAWLVARDSQSLSDLFGHVRYTGRPPLWYLVLYGISRFSNDVNALKLLAFSISSLTLALIIFVVNTSIRSKIALLSGFYFLFGFSVLSRDYLLILLFVVLLYVTYQSKLPPETKIVRILLLCTPLSAVNIFGILIVISILISLLLLNFASGLRNGNKWWTILALSAFNLFWLIFMILISRPPKDHVFAVSPPYEVTNLSANSFKIIFWKSIGFFAQVIAPFWGNYQVSRLTLIPSILGMLLLLLFFRNLKRELKPFFVSLTLVFYLFHIFGYSPFWWHRGSFTIISMLLALTLLTRDGYPVQSFGRVVVYTLFAIQIAASFFGLGKTFWQDSVYSNASKASAFISKICDDNSVIVAENDLSSSAMSAYLPDYRFFYLNRFSFGTFTSWKHSDFGKRVTSWSEIELKSLGLSPCAYVLPLDSRALPPSKFKVVSFTGSVWGDDYIIVLPIEK